MFNGENLANLRIMHGLSRKQLAHFLEVTEQAIWQFENNYTSPKLQTVNGLKHIFDVKTKYFYTDDILTQKHVPSRIHDINIAYRSKVLHSVTKTRAEAKHLEFLDIFIDEITSSITYPTLKIIQLRDKAIKYMSTTNHCRDVQISNIAKLAREWLGLSNDSNDNLMFLVEKSGVFISEKAIGEDIDAYSLWTESDRSYIILGNLKRSAARRNFDIAHELGHLLLHYRYNFGNMDRNEHKMIEKEADTFAGAFLLPTDAFTTDMKSIQRLTNPDAYLDLKKKWNVSLQVLGYRAANLGIMESKQHRNFYAALHRKGYLKTEPLDGVIELQKPMKVKSIIDLVFSKGLIEIQYMLDKEWKVELPFFSKLTGIDTSFFEQYATNYKSINFAKVTELASYR